MQKLIALDLAQLKQVQAAIAAVSARPLAEQNRKRYLLDALRREEATLRSYCKRARLHDAIAA
jgi:hypothetical protein